MLKTCTCCKESKDISKFSNRKYTNKKGEVIYKSLSICKKCNSAKSKAYYYKFKNGLKYVYRFLDIDGNVIYVGKTEKLMQRIRSHFSCGHLPKKCYEETCKIQYICMKSIVLMDIKELYYINLYKPKYNTNHIVNEPIIVIKEFTNDLWLDYNEDNLSQFKIGSIDNTMITGRITPYKISSIFCRKRNNRYLVYIEYLIHENSTKKQNLKGSFDNEEEARNFVSVLKNLYNFKL